MPINEKCYYATATRKKIVTPDQAIAIRDKTGKFIGECLRPECAGRIYVSRQSKSGAAAHFQHAETANEKCPLARPHRPA